MGANDQAKANQAEDDDQGALQQGEEDTATVVVTVADPVHARSAVHRIRTIARVDEHDETDRRPEQQQSEQNFLPAFHQIPPKGLSVPNRRVPQEKVPEAMGTICYFCLETHNTHHLFKYKHWFNLKRTNCSV